ncbi:hypothetical protein PCASD_19446 [Puccinia coronata f. sp. avenae]|uniref:CTLH domain-containing protein n=1 Tax=Puccinia coronata f. sp. avenae TaxID=200324 RepID=A0A2N5T972_9BASI|nr:hypothetical protein PCASD_19446 [Puccinia coronata f. sp. avenae]
MYPWRNWKLAIHDHNQKTTYHRSHKTMSETVDRDGDQFREPIEGSLADSRSLPGQREEDDPVERVGPSVTRSDPALFGGGVQQESNPAGRSVTSTPAVSASQAHLASPLPTPPVRRHSTPLPQDEDHDARPRIVSDVDAPSTASASQPLPAQRIPPTRSSSTAQSTLHPRPETDSHRPAKRPRYAVLSMDQSNHHIVNIVTATSSSIQPPLYSDDDDDEMSDAGLTNSHAPLLLINNHSSNSPSSSSHPRLHPQHQSSPSKSPKPLPPTTALNHPQDLQSLLKNFSDGLHALAPQLLSPSSAVENHPSLPVDSQVHSPNLPHARAHPSPLPWPLISDIDREEIVRLLLQSLKEIGYPAAAMTLEVESGFTLDPSPEITSFRQNILSGNWLAVNELLQREYLKYCDPPDQNEPTSCQLSPTYNKHESCDSRIAKSLFGVDAHVLKLAIFLVMQEKYLELLESRQIRKALVVLRSEIAPLVSPPNPNDTISNHISKSPTSGIGSSFNKLPFGPDGKGALATWANNHDEDPGVQRLCLLSSLMMCSTSEEVRDKAEWDGVAFGSRVRLLEELQELIPPQILVPHHRLPHLLEQSKTLQRLQCLYHVTNPKISLLSNHTCSRSAFPTETSHVLTRHSDEVWRIEWSHDGLRLASADRAKTCIIWKLKSSKSPKLTPGFSNGDSPRLHRTSRFSGGSPDKKPSTHRPHVTSHDEELDFEVDLVLDRHPDGIACVAWSPDDSVLLTGADCTITMWNTRTGECIATMVKHEYEVCALSWLPDGRSFVSGGLDTNVLFWDLKGQNTYKLQVGPTRIADLCVSPDGKRLVAVGTAKVDHLSGSEHAHDGINLTNGTDSPGRLSSNRQGSRSNEPGGSVDQNKQGRMHIFNIPEKRQIAMIPLSPELTCVSISDDSKYALINQPPNQVLLYSLEDHKLIRRFVGQKQGQFIIRSCFGGLDRNFILSGSEDGKIYVWHMETGALIEVLSGHGEGTVNAVAWNSNHPPLFASAGDDHTVRIWQAPNPKRIVPSHPAQPQNLHPKEYANGASNRSPTSSELHRDTDDRSLIDEEDDQNY